MIRVVFDTNILFSAVFKEIGIPARVFDLVVAGVLTPCVSDAVLAEYRDVLSRPVLREHTRRAMEVLDLIDAVGDHVFPAVSLSVCSDPDDNCFLECAEAASAEYLITGNTKHFPASHRQTKVVTARQLLELLGL
jgi:putative PIN family toxin of toxin-antitoxin system